LLLLLLLVLLDEVAVAILSDDLEADDAVKSFEHAWLASNKKNVSNS